MDCITNAEKAILEKLYPEGCRGELVYIDEDSCNELIPGDLGTVQFIDGCGQIHISWDNGSNRTLAYKADSCRCLMTNTQLEELLEILRKMLFEDWEKTRNWLEDRLLPVFPKMFFRPTVNNEMIVELGCEVFKMSRAKISIQYVLDDKQCVSIEQCELCG